MDHLTSFEASDLQTLAGSQYFNWTSHDHLRLLGHIWEASNPSCPPLLCLPGLTRNTRDFFEIARVLQASNITCIALDYRGRGQSQHSPDHTTYTIAQEAEDIALAIKQLGLKRFSILGTSRGGIHAMSFAMSHKQQLAAIILNDVGPVLGTDALEKIVASVGTHMTQPRMEVAAEHLKEIHAASFPELNETDWLRFANQLYVHADEGVKLPYDPKLGVLLRETYQPDTPVDMWPLFHNLKSTPHMLIHGENSPLLSRDVVADMQESHPNLQLITAQNEGHAPLLWDEVTQTGILHFLLANQ